MKILVLNSGSSSIKFQLFNMKEENVLAKGRVTRIGNENSTLKYESEKQDKFKKTIDISNHSDGLQVIKEYLLSDKKGVIKNIDDIDAIGHRVVHGGEAFSRPTLIDAKVENKIDELSDLAPLHNPHNLTGIKECKKIFPGKPQTAVFDTGFHQTIPEKAYLYAIPYEYYEKYGIRRYGFHGTSHKFVAKRAAELMNTPLDELKLISCHLGNGASMAAIKHGNSIDTSMGLTPLEGLVMGTRCGDIDPAIVPFMMNKLDISAEEMDTIMNKESGLYGVSGVSNDSRDVEEAAEAGNHQAEVALKIFDYRVKKYIGAYTAAMGGVDAIVFTAGIGENSIETRENILGGLEYLGLELDKEANNCRSKEQIISTEDSKVKALVIPTNEELVIARDTMEIVSE